MKENKQLKYSWNLNSLWILFSLTLIKSAITALDQNYQITKDGPEIGQTDLGGAGSTRMVTVTPDSNTIVACFQDYNAVRNLAPTLKTVFVFDSSNPSSVTKLKNPEQELGAEIIRSCGFIDDNKLVLAEDLTYRFYKKSSSFSSDGGFESDSTTYPDIPIVFGWGMGLDVKRGGPYFAVNDYGFGATPENKGFIYTYTGSEWKQFYVPITDSFAMCWGVTFDPSPSSSLGTIFCRDWIAMVDVSKPVDQAVSHQTFRLSYTFSADAEYSEYNSSRLLIVKGDTGVRSLVYATTSDTAYVSLRKYSTPSDNDYYKDFEAWHSSVLNLHESEAFIVIKSAHSDDEINNKEVWFIDAGRWLETDSTRDQDEDYEKRMINLTPEIETFISSTDNIYFDHEHFNKAQYQMIFMIQYGADTAATNAVTFKIEICHHTCDGCTAPQDPNACTSCWNGLTLVDENGDGSGYCPYKCSDRCSNGCNGNNDDTRCKFCSNGMAPTNIINGFGTCPYKCSIRCSDSCTSEDEFFNSCQTCKIGYELPTGTTSGTCYDCSSRCVNGCDGDKDHTKCKACANGVTPTNIVNGFGTCPYKCSIRCAGPCTSEMEIFPACSSCKPGYEFPSSEITSGTSEITFGPCLDCSERCSGGCIFDNDDTKCRGCTNGMELISVDSGFGKCPYKCSIRCMDDCTSEDELFDGCTRCKIDYILVPKNPSIKNLGSCLKCHDMCKDGCSAPNDITKCKACRNGLSPVKVDQTGFGTCLYKCQISCSDPCTSEILEYGSCKICNDGYELKSDSPSQCVELPGDLGKPITTSSEGVIPVADCDGTEIDGCLKCSEEPKGYCLFCVKGSSVGPIRDLIDIGKEKGGKNCVKCPVENCEECDVESDGIRRCQNCKTGFVLKTFSFTKQTCQKNIVFVFAGGLFGLMLFFLI